MSRTKKSRKPGGAPTAKPKLSKVELSSIEKRVRKKTGKKPGNRQQEANLDNNVGDNATQKKDPRIGSKKPIDLGGSVDTSQRKLTSAQSAKANTKTVKAKQDPLAALRCVETEKVDVELSLAQELANIESDAQLLTILEKQEDELTLTQCEVNYFNNMMDRHHIISEQLGEEDEEIISKGVSSEEDLWDKLDNASFEDSSK